MIKTTPIARPFAPLPKPGKRIAHQTFTDIPPRNGYPFPALIL